MSDTTASLRRKISSAGDLQSVVRTMKALAASSTLARVASDTSPRLRNTRLTVISDPPEASETSRRVRGRAAGPRAAATPTL